MSLRVRARSAVAAVAVAVLAGCASIPVTGAVQEGGDETGRGPDIGQIASGPTADAEPEVIVNDFLRAAQAGPTSTAAFSVAREYLTEEAAKSWSPDAPVMVTDGVPQPVLAPDADPASDHVSVTVKGTVLASVDERGVFTEESPGLVQESTLELVREAGQWRIARLDDGMMVPSAFFGSTFHVTTLYFPTPDRKSWVPDRRWFPQKTWRTNAVKELLAGPPGYLAGSTAAVLPAGTGLAMNSVVEGADGSFQVSLTDLSDVSGDARGLFAAQLRATLADQRGEADVTLIDPNGPVVPPEVDVPQHPRTPGAALVLRDDALWTLEARSLTQSELNVHLDGLDPQALAVNQAGDVVVVRDGEQRLVRVTGDEPTVLLEGATRLLPPSIDLTETVWTGDQGGPLVVVTPDGEHHDLDVHWLVDRTVTSVRVSPEGARVAIASTGTGGASVQVAGIVRDARGIPTALSDPITVGASVRGVEQAVWQEEAVLALLGRDETGGSAVFFAGVGGLGSAVGGAPRRIAGVTDPVRLSASVGSGDVLAVDAEGALHLRQPTALWWPAVGAGVTLAAFAG